MQPLVRKFAAHLAAHPDIRTSVGTRPSRASAVLFYGSNLRTGALDGVLDFYVLTPGPAERGIWPRVSYHEWEQDGVLLRAKVATMALATFHQAAAGELMDTTIWARFVQPVCLAWSADSAAQKSVTTAIGAAAMTAARLSAALGPAQGYAQDYWRALFRATYRAEFRLEKAGRENSILSAKPAHYDQLLVPALEAGGIRVIQLEDGRIAPELDRATRQQILKWWRARSRIGKPYNLLRLLRASATFTGAARYAAWKIERHTGIPVEVTPWREKHPVLAAPGVLWRIWRDGRKAP